jgi:hypothetical protein
VNGGGDSDNASDGTIDFGILKRLERLLEQSEAREAKRDERLERLERVLDGRDDIPRPLAEILKWSAARARMFVRRNPSLAALGVPASTRTMKFKPGTKSPHLERHPKGIEMQATRLLFRRSNVDAWFAARKATVRK